MKLSNSIRNSMIGQYEVYLGVNPVLEIRTGVQPAACEDSDTGVVLASIVLPNDWMVSPTNGTVSLQGTWNGIGSAGGVAGHYRLKNAGGNCHEQGTVYQSGGVGSGDLGLDNTNIAPNQIVQVTTWTRTQGGQ